MNSVTEEYIIFIRRELDKLEQGKFTGNIGFKVNLKEGGIANMNVELNKSIKLIENPALYSDRR